MPPAQPNATQGIPQENLKFIVGDILEMLPVTDMQNPTYAWVLTEGETFLQAGRARFFRVRFIRPGTYYLHAELGGGNGERVRRLFVMEVEPRDHNEQSSQNGDGNLIRSTPAIDGQNRIALPRDKQLVTLSPVSVEKRPLFLDLDTRTDSDGNGNASDDRDASDSFFETSATPLQLWFPQLPEPRTINVRLGDSSGSALQQAVTVYAGNLPVGPTSSQAPVASPLTIVARPTGPGAFQFSVTFDGGAPQVPLLLRWDFGDGTESLLTDPTHAYDVTGPQTVSVQVRNLLTGQDIGSAETTVTPGATAVSSAAAASQASVASKPTTSKGSGWLWTILVMFLIFLIAAGIGFLIIWLLKRLRGGKSLQDNLATMEKTIVAKPEPDASKGPPALTFAAATAVPTQLPAAPKKEPISAPAPVQTSAKQEEPERSAPKPLEPNVNRAAAPSWLQKGLDATPAQTTLDTKAPAPPTPKPTPAPVPPPAPSAPSVKPNASADLPPWLAAAQTPKPTTPPPPAPKPAAPSPAPAPKPAPTPPAPAPSPAPSPAPAAKKTPEPPPASAEPKKSEVGKPAPTPVAVETPPPSLPPAKPAPLVTPPPPPAPKPLPPAPAPAPTTTPAPDDTSPVAFVQVDSLKTDEPSPPKT